jgi:vacuolar protein sorting-associated protein 13A/C
MNLGNQPVEILIEDVYLLVVPSPQTNVDPDEEERRAQAAKAERLENAELLHMRGQAEINTGTIVIFLSGRLLAKHIYRR